MPHSSHVIQFLAVSTPDELAVYLGYPSYKELTSIIYPKPFYRTFVLRKKNGSFRGISAPALKIKIIQLRLASAITQLDKSRDSVHGFRECRSVLTNAKPHAFGKKGFVLNLDLQDFFGSISFFRIRGLFQSDPFNFPWSISTILAHITCYNGVLPQGAPTSPILSNFICRGLDGKLQELAMLCRATYTRYADDISFSFSRRTRSQLPERIVAALGSSSVIGAELAQIISTQGFSINFSKVRLLHYGQRMEVTGLTVNQVPNVRRKYVDEIRGMLHAWKKYGLPAANAIFAARPRKRQRKDETIPNLEDYLRGKLSYLKMVKGEADRVYVKLGRMYNDLVRATPSCKAAELLIAATVIDDSEIDFAVYVVHCIDQMNMQESEGTAFFLHPYGIVTCEHVVRFPAERVTEEDKKLPNGYFGFTAGQIFLEDQSGRKICEAKVSQVNEHADIAILTPSSDPVKKLLSLTPARIPGKKGEVVTLLGFPDHTSGKGLSATRGHITNLYPRSGVQLFDINEQIQKGNSGGPVINGQLEVIGIAMEGQRDMKKSNAVVSIEMIPNLLASNSFEQPSTQFIADISPPPKEPLSSRSESRIKKFIAFLKAWLLI